MELTITIISWGSILGALICFVANPIKNLGLIEWEGIRNFGESLIGEIIAILGTLLILWALDTVLGVIGEEQPWCVILAVGAFLWFITRGIFAPMWFLYNFTVIPMLLFYGAFIVGFFYGASWWVETLMFGRADTIAEVLLLGAALCGGSYAIGFLTTGILGLLFDC